MVIVGRLASGFALGFGGLALASVLEGVALTSRPVASTTT